MLEHITVDVLIAGGGVGGLMAAHHASRAGARVLLLGGSGGASSRISSMITALGNSDIDTPEGLYDDMFRSGGFVNRVDLLTALTERIGPETRELVSDGVPFHFDGDQPARRQTTGCTWPSAVYSLTMIGVDISRHLERSMAAFDSPPEVVHGGVLLSIGVGEGRVTGGLAYSPREKRWISVSASAIVLATGGAGQLFGTTTNPRGSKGTGYALALEAGCELVDMEFVSFEPFITTTPGDTKRHDLPTTVLKQGAKLRNGLGEEFLDTENAPTKDVICRAMVTEVVEGRGTANDSVYYDIRDMDPEIVGHYVQIGQALRSNATSSEPGMLEVMPAQHYLMGGVRIDAQAATSVPGLFAVGEVAGGAHGGHRLAGAGGMEVVAGGAIAGESAAQYALAQPGPSAPSGVDRREAPELFGSFRSARKAEQLRTIADALHTECGIFRNGPGLSAATGAIRGVLDEARTDPAQALVRRAAQVALSIAESARRREESRGDHFRTDYRLRNDAAWSGNQVVALADDGGLDFRYEPASPASQRKDTK